MKSAQKELDELTEQMELLQAEIDAIDEEISSELAIRVARKKFLELRKVYLSKTLEKLQERRVARIRYEEWDRRTRP